MHKISCLEQHYAQWLAHNRIPHPQTLLLDFRTILDPSHRPTSQLTTSQINHQTHLQFLLQLLPNAQTGPQISFHSIILTLNSILRARPKTKLPLKAATLCAIGGYLLRGREVLESACMTSSALWLICRGVHGASSKRAVLLELQKSELLPCLLVSASLDQLGQRALALLLYHTSKNKPDKRELAIKVLESSHKFDDGEAVKHILATLRGTELSFYQSSRQTNSLLAKFILHYISIQTIALSAKAENLELILHVAAHNPHLLPQLQIFEFLQLKLSQPALAHEPLLEQLTRVVQLESREKGRVGRYLDAAVETLANNIVSRRLFILFHDDLTQAQLFRVLSRDFPPSLLKEADSTNQILSAIKFVICLKRAVASLGYNQIFWYACKPLIVKILECSQSLVREEEREIYEMFEEGLEEEIALVRQI